MCTTSVVFLITRLLSPIAWPLVKEVILVHWLRNDQKTWWWVQMYTGCLHMSHFWSIDCATCHT
jgi:hypothetical protein